LLSLFLLKEKVTIPIAIGTRKTRSLRAFFHACARQKPLGWTGNKIIFRFIVELVAVTICKKKFANEHFRLCVFAFNHAHPPKADKLL
jgi:hypothetical protein